MSMPLTMSLPHHHRPMGVLPIPKHLATQPPHPRRLTHSTTHRRQGHQPCESTGASPNSPLTNFPPLTPPLLHQLQQMLPSLLVSAGITQTSFPPMLLPLHKAPTSPAPAPRATTRWHQVQPATRTPTLQLATTPHPHPWPIRCWSAGIPLRWWARMGLRPLMTAMPGDLFPTNTAPNSLTG